uniref:Uncharacterized protein n=1 Tax=Brassica oleracea var. oleracea TaxID=109376 RepID=A0A0D3AH61_BRAOL
MHIKYVSCFLFLLFILWVFAILAIRVLGLLLVLIEGFFFPIPSIAGLMETLSEQDINNIVISSSNLCLLL